MHYKHVVAEGAHRELLHVLQFIYSVGDLNNITTSSCGGIYGLIEQLLVDLDVTERCCLSDNSTCANNSTSRTNPAKGTIK